MQTNGARRVGAKMCWLMKIICDQRDQQSHVVENELRFQWTDLAEPGQAAVEFHEGGEPLAHRPAPLGDSQGGP